MNRSPEALRGYDGKRIAVLLRFNNQRVAVCGKATYEYDSLLGNVLRITPEPDSDGVCEVMISESKWDGRVTPDSRYDCDFCFIPSPAWAPS